MLRLLVVLRSKMLKNRYNKSHPKVDGLILLAK